MGRKHDNARYERDGAPGYLDPSEMARMKGKSRKAMEALALLQVGESITCKREDWGTLRYHAVNARNYSLGKWQYRTCTLADGSHRLWRIK